MNKFAQFVIYYRIFPFDLENYKLPNIKISLQKDGVHRLHNISTPRVLMTLSGNESKVAVDTTERLLNSLLKNNAIASYRRLL